MSIDYQTLREEQFYPHEPSRVFRAWAEPDVKREWFTFSHRDGEEWSGDFRVEGIEYYRSPPGDVPAVTYTGRYYDIVDNERIILATETTIDGHRTSVTLNTAEFHRAGAGTLLTVTEQAAFLDGGESVHTRADGIRTQLTRLGRLFAPPDPA